MKIALLHTADALEPPVDPVLDQIQGALEEGGHECRRLVVSDEVEPLVTSLTNDRPEIVFNIAESFAGRSALAGLVPRARRPSGHPHAEDLGGSAAAVRDGG